MCLSRVTLATDGPAPFTQYVRLSARFLEFLPMGGACRVVACIAGDTNGPDSFRDLAA